MLSHLTRRIFTASCAFGQRAFKWTMSFKSTQALGGSLYEPKKQDYFTFSQEGIWKPSTSEQRALHTDHPIDPKLIRLLSWNIDFRIPFGQERMDAALDYLQEQVSSIPAQIPIIIFFQEMVSLDLRQIRDSPWIQQRFHLTDTTPAHWLSHYGTTTLIDRRLLITDVFRVPWLSNFDRDGLFVDIALTHPNSSSSSTSKVLRLCNVHLESLVADPPIRPTQMAAAAKYLHQPNVACALLAGDCNAIQPFDRTLHSDNNLHDTFLILGGKEDTEDSFTWGQQVPKQVREQFGCSRMDKIMFTGDVMPKTFERIGMGTKVAEGTRERLREAGQDEFVTDHYGVMGEFEVSAGWQLSKMVGSEERANLA